MTSLFTRFAGVLLSAALLGSASAQIDTVTSSFDEDTGDADVRAAVGAVLTIDGANFGTAKPKVFLLDELTGKKYVLKVTDFDDAQIVAEIKKAVAGSLQLNVLPKGAEAAFTSTVIIETPRIDELLDEAGTSNVDEASPGTVFQIVGEYLGLKKGKVRIGGKVAKVLEWFNDHVVLTMPKKLANGLWIIALDNKVAVNDEVDITMVGSTVKIGKLFLDVFVGGEKLKLKFGAGANPGGYAVVALGTSGTNPSKSFVLAVPFIDGTEVPEDYVFGTDLFVVSYIETPKFTLGGPPPIPRIWTPTVGYTVNITANSAGQVAGNFAGIMESATEPDVEVHGEFVVDIEEG